MQLENGFGIQDDETMIEVCLHNKYVHVHTFFWYFTEYNK